MSYDYATEKPWIFTEEGQKTFLWIRDRANFFHRQTGAFTVEKVTENAPEGSSWSRLACVDRLVEINEFEYVTEGITQFRVLRKVEYHGR